jgi:hypothetical protein
MRRTAALRASARAAGEWSRRFRTPALGSMPPSSEQSWSRSSGATTGHVVAQPSVASAETAAPRVNSGAVNPDSANLSSLASVAIRRKRHGR